MAEGRRDLRLGCHRLVPRLFLRVERLLLAHHREVVGATQQRRLGVEHEVDRLDRHICSLGDLRHRRTRVAPLGKERICSLNDPPVRCLGPVAPG